MRKWISPVLLGLVVVCAASPCAWGGVAVSWLDAGGSQSISLSLIINPDYIWPPTPEFPQGREWWIPEVWYGELPITFGTLDPISFVATGNFNNGSGTAVKYVRLKQTVLNSTTETWYDFHIGITSGGQFYKKWLLQGGWNGTQNPTTFDFTSTSWEYNIAPGGTFEDGVEIVATSVDGSGDGTILFTKFPSVPEVGGLIALLSGMAGVARFLVRRRT